MKGNQRGVLTLAATTFMIMNYLPYVIKKFIEKYPHVRLTILERRWNEIVTLAQSGEIDFGIAPIAFIPSNLNYVKLKPIDRILITSSNHPLAKKNDITLLDIAQYPMITYEKGLVSRDEFDKVFEDIQLDIDVIMEATNAETIKRYVEMGIGIAIIPKMALSQSQTNQLKSFSVNKYFGKSQYGVILRKGKHVTTWATNFLLLLNPSLESQLQSFADKEIRKTT